MVEDSVIIICSVSFVCMSLIFLILRLGNLFSRPKEILTSSQKEAELEAIKLLTRAQALLREDDRNVDEAQRLRYEVTHRLLPSKRMYIVRQHPRSLLKDVDRQILRARYRLYKNGDYDSDPVEEPATHFPTLEEVNNARRQRYRTIAQQLQYRKYWSFGFVAVLLILIAIGLMVMGRDTGFSAFRNSFRWIPY